MRNLLTTISLLVSFVLYVPLYRRILIRRTTGDFSKTAQWLILYLQVNNLTIAFLDHSSRLVWIYAINAVLVAGVIALVYRFYGGRSVE